MNESDETLEQLSDRELLISLVRDVAEIKKTLANHDAQFEAIRSGIVANSAAFDRLQAKVLNLSADVKELTEEVRKKEPVI